jgi:hypothetical protein
LTRRNRRPETPALPRGKLCLCTTNRYAENTAGSATHRKQNMNVPMEMDNLAVKRVRLEVLKREHRDLDEAIHVLETSGRGDQLRLRRLKKQKLALKDEIARLEDDLTPDIIA